MRDSKAEFQFLDFTSRKPKPDVPETSYEDYKSKLRAMRPVAYALLAFWLAVYAIVAWGMGWFDRWLS